MAQFQRVLAGQASCDGDGRMTSKNRTIVRLRWKCTSIRDGAPPSRDSAPRPAIVHLQPRECTSSFDRALLIAIVLLLLRSRCPNSARLLCNHQPGSCSSGSRCEIEQSRKRRLVDEAAVPRIDQVILCFRDRRSRVAQKPDEFLPVESPEPFSDVSRCRGAGIADLIAEFEVARSRTSGSKCKHFRLQCVRELPTREISEVMNAHARRQAQHVPSHFDKAHCPSMIVHLTLDDGAPHFRR